MYLLPNFKAQSFLNALLFLLLLFKWGWYLDLQVSVILPRSGMKHKVLEAHKWEKRKRTGTLLLSFLCAQCCSNCFTDIISSFNATTTPRSQSSFYSILVSPSPGDCLPLSAHQVQGNPFLTRKLVSGGVREPRPPHYLHSTLFSSPSFHSAICTIVTCLCTASAIKPFPRWLTWPRI